jgi:hypothetical protein
MVMPLLSKILWFFWEKNVIKKIPIHFDVNPIGTLVKKVK